jgi:hypothetical protein
MSGAGRWRTRGVWGRHLAQWLIARALANGPIWTILVVVAVGFLCTIVSTIFPQDSADRLTWWKEFWRHRRAGDQHKSGEKTNKNRQRLRKTAEGTEQPETT